MELRNICVLTGTRAEFGLLRPVMDAIQAHPALRLSVLVTGMHLVPAFGNTIREIESSGYPISGTVDMHPEADTGAGMARAIAQGISGFSSFLEAQMPSFLLLLGDRTEVLAAAIAAMYQNIPIAHIHGGDITRGGIDENVRHAVTKMASLHFPATPGAAGRILRMGEDPWRITCAGAPGLDVILHTRLPEIEEVHRRNGTQPEHPYLLLVQHPVTTQTSDAGSQIRATLEALDKVNMNIVAIYPNSDAGSAAIIKELETRKGDRFAVFRSLPHSDYLCYLRHARALVGNSSSGIIESASLGVPVVNIGIRQEGRERAANVIDATPEASSIYLALEKALEPAFREQISSMANPYGNGQAGKRIAEVLATIPMDERLIQKKYYEQPTYV